MSFISKSRRFAMAGFGATGLGFMMTGIVAHGHVQFVLGAVFGIIALALIGWELFDQRFSIKVEVHPEVGERYVNRDVSRDEPSQIRQRHMQRHVVAGRPHW